MENRKGRERTGKWTGTNVFCGVLHISRVRLSRLCQVNFFFCSSLLGLLDLAM